MRRGFSIVELMASISLSVGLLLLLHEGIRLATLWATSTGQLMGDVTRADDLRAALLDLNARGRMVEALSIGPDGSLAEAARPDAVRTFQGAALVRGEDAYWAIAAEDGVLVRRRIGFDGRAGREVLLAGVAGARFELLRAGGSPAGWSWEVTDRAGRRIGGFVARRRDLPLEGPPAAPALAPRWKSGGR